MVIKKNTHAPLRLPKLLLFEEYLTARVEFTDSCRYDIGEEQLDVNKLFGIGYFPGHHNNSVRFGWRYDKEQDAIEILSYFYNNKKRDFCSMGWVQIGFPAYYTIFIRENEHILTIATTIRFDEIAEVSVPVKAKKVGYLLRPYFGGNKKAPHDIEIKIEL